MISQELRATDKVERDISATDKTENKTQVS